MGGWLRYRSFPSYFRSHHQQIKQAKTSLLVQTNIYTYEHNNCCVEKVSTLEGSSPFPITGFVVLEKPHESSSSTSSVVDLVANDQPRWTPNLTSNSRPILSFHHRFHWVDVEQMEGVGKVISRLFSWDSIALQSVRLSHFLTFGPTHYCSTCPKDKDKDTILQNLDLKKNDCLPFLLVNLLKAQIHSSPICIVTTVRPLAA